MKLKPIPKLLDIYEDKKKKKVFHYELLITGDEFVALQELLDKKLKKKEKKK